MHHLPDIHHSYVENYCELKLPIKKSGRSIENIRNCDIFLEEYDFLIYLDVQLYLQVSAGVKYVSISIKLSFAVPLRFHSIRRFDLKDLGNIYLNYNPNQQTLKVSLPCQPLGDEAIETNKPANSLLERPLDLWKLKRITDNCLLRINDNPVLLKPQASFGYGFAGKYRGRIKSFEFKCNLEHITRIAEPGDVSPLQRSIDREIDEMKSFNREQYQLNFIELQVPDGLDNPMLYSFNFKECALGLDEQKLLHILTSQREVHGVPDEYDISEIDYGLINILMAICYDIRFTSGAPNCESYWTRSVLSATLSYFESFTSLKEVVVSFMRRSLIYPLYRNYDLSRQCVKDCVYALHNNPIWIMKQFLISHEIFETKERTVFNHYYIDDYIRYLSNETLCPLTHFQMLACNLKNVLLDISKKDLGLGLRDLETELLKELINDIHMNDTSSDEDDGNAESYGDSDSEDDCTTESSEECSSDTSGDSVIKQNLNDLKSL